MKQILFLLMTIGIFGISTPKTAYSQELGIPIQHLIQRANNLKKLLDSDDPEAGFKPEENQRLNLLRISISAKDRLLWNKLNKYDNWTNAEKTAFDASLNSLALSLRRELPNHLPLDASFRYKNAVQERLIKQTLNNLETLKIYKSGFDSPSWVIAKNNFGIPTVRYKHGFIYAKDSTDNHEFCHLYNIILGQSYSGGGTFAGSYTRLENDWLVGCP